MLMVRAVGWCECPCRWWYCRTSRLSSRSGVGLTPRLEHTEAVPRGRGRICAEDLAGLRDGVLLTDAVPVGQVAAATGSVRDDHHLGVELDQSIEYRRAAVVPAVICEHPATGLDLAEVRVHVDRLVVEHEQRLVIAVGVVGDHPELHALHAVGRAGVQQVTVQATPAPCCPLLPQLVVAELRDAGPLGTSLVPGRSHTLGARGLGVLHRQQHCGDVVVGQAPLESHVSLFDLAFGPAGDG